jgi:hypothetical protein
MTLLLVRGSRGMRATKIRHVMAVIPVAVGAPVVAGTTSIMDRVVLLLGRMSKGRQR